MIEVVLSGVTRHTKRRANKTVCQIINVAGTNVVDILFDDFQIAQPTCTKPIQKHARCKKSRNLTKPVTELNQTDEPQVNVLHFVSSVAFYHVWLLCLPLYDSVI